MRFEARQRPLVAGGATILALAVLLHALRGSEPPPSAAPIPMQPPVAATADPQPAPPPATSPEGLRLHGVMGAGAVIGDSAGQRFVATGREVRPGLAVERVGIDHVLLRSRSGPVRLDFAGSTAVAAPSVAGAPTGEAALHEETLRYRLGLAPRQQEGRVIGHLVRPGASMPALQRAGIRSGDIILSVNGSRFDQERMLELAWTLANSGNVAFEVERGGRRISLGAAGVGQ